MCAEAYGPVVGILFNRHFSSLLRTGNTPLEATGYYYSAQAAGVRAFLFAVDDVEPHRRKISGWSKGVSGTWVYAPMPWPDFFYDQAKDMPKAERATVDVLRQVMHSLSTPVNTRRFLDKWFLHKALLKDPGVAKLLPATVICTKPRELKTMLSRYLAVIAKPTNSSRGRGISVIRVKRDKRLCVESFDGKVADNLSLAQGFREVLQTARRNKVLLQRHLEMQTANGRPFDLRMLMGKNRQGEWIAVSPRLRLGQEDSIITNTNRGADRLPLLASLAAAVGKHRAEELYRQAEWLAKRVCRSIERTVGPMGELGLDFIVDKRGRFWFIEANPQPGKTPLLNEMLATTPLLYRHVMDYCAYLWQKQ